MSTHFDITEMEDKPDVKGLYTAIEAGIRMRGTRFVLEMIEHNLFNNPDAEFEPEDVEEFYVYCEDTAFDRIGFVRGDE